MTFKRNVDRLPIIPKDATVHNVTCNFCIVGCGYKAYSWDVSRQGGPPPATTGPASTWASSSRPRPTPGTRPPCTTSSARTAGRCTSSSSPTRTAS